MKYIGLVRRHPLDHDQLKHVTMIDPSHTPDGGTKRAKTHHRSKRELDSPPDALWLCRGGPLANA